MKEMIFRIGILRILFIRYLIDRGIFIGYRGLDDDIEMSKENFLHIVQNKNDLLGLFRYLKEKFNGNLFAVDENKEKQDKDKAFYTPEFLANCQIMKIKSVPLCWKSI